MPSVVHFQARILRNTISFRNAIESLVTCIEYILYSSTEVRSPLQVVQMYKR